MLPPQPQNGYIVNTDRRTYPYLEAEERMLKENCVFVTGTEQDFRPLREIKEGDAVFLWANEVGVISFGIAVGEPWVRVLHHVITTQELSSSGVYDNSEQF